ncbi:hypothetical protein [Streptomyces sp. GESEQ-35]|nr:hypothetical protein [Streptomyces sp. GESEQ-35]
MPERLLPTTPASGHVPVPPPLAGLAPDAVPGVAALSLIDHLRTREAAHA